MSKGIAYILLLGLAACSISEMNKIDTYQNVWRAKVTKKANELLNNKGKYRDIAILGCDYKSQAKIIIESTGRLSSVNIQKKSDFIALDELIIEAIETSAPFMPFDNYLPDSDRITLEQTFVVLPVASACIFTGK